MPASTLDHELRDVVVDDFPWSNFDAALPSGIPGMITPSEASYLRWLTSRWYTGRGAVVEVGPWLGASTSCLAEGLRANGAGHPPAPLEILDNWRWQPFMAPRAPGVVLERGASFRPVFEANLAPHLDLLRLHEARLPDEAIGDHEFDEPMRDHDSGLPLFDGSSLAHDVEIAFIDGAKSWPAAVHLVQQLAPRAIPGSTLWVWQDMKAGGGYWIPMIVAHLRAAVPGCLRVEHVLPYNSVALRQERAIPESVLRDLPRSLADISPVDGLSLLAAMGASLRAAGDHAGERSVLVGDVWFLAAKDRWADAEARLNELSRAFPARGTERDLLERTRRWLGERTDQRLRPPPRQRLHAGVRRVRTRAAAALGS